MIKSLLSAREFFEKTALFKLLDQTRIDEIFRLCGRHFGSSAGHGFQDICYAARGVVII